MISVEGVTKTFEGFKALDNLSCNIPKGSVYGLVGSNGAGKSTLLRLITGVYKPDFGKISLEGLPVYENVQAKGKMFFVPDELFFLPQANVKRMGSFYQSFYRGFNKKRFYELLELFKFDPKKSINTLSKGMKRQIAIILALSVGVEYIFFDETFDGLDPVMRNVVKKLIYDEVIEREATIIMTSHSLRELEDTCDQLALLHKGGIVFESDVNNLKVKLFKVQVAFEQDFDETLFNELEIVSLSKKGRVVNLIIRGNREKTLAFLKGMNPAILDVLPLTLEEVFLYEMEALGYRFDNGGVEHENI